MTHYTTTSANINSSAFRADQRPRSFTCDICLQAPAVRRVTRRMEGGEYWTANCCAMCAEKVGK